MAKTVKTGCLVGQKIKEVRVLTAAEMKKQHWEQDNLELPPIVIVTEDGTKLFPSRDSEGNAPGTMFGETPRGKGFYVTKEP
jgi:hypothetical protein